MQYSKSSSRNLKVDEKRWVQEDLKNIWKKIFEQAAFGSLD